MFVICFISQWMKRSKRRLFVFLPKKTLIWRRHCLIGQSCCSMAWKRSIDWFLESSRGRSFCTQAFAWPTKGHVYLYPFYNQIKLLHLRLFVVSVLFGHFHFKVIWKSLSELSSPTAYNMGTNGHEKWESSKRMSYNHIQRHTAEGYWSGEC